MLATTEGVVLCCNLSEPTILVLQKHSPYYFCTGQVEATCFARVYDTHKLGEQPGARLFLSENVNASRKFTFHSYVT